MVAPDAGPMTVSPVATALPNFFRNQGAWQGIHRSIDLNGMMISADERCVEISFPTGVDYQHVSRSFKISDENVYRAVGEVRGILIDRFIYWDEADFSGRAWDSDAGTTLLEIIRKDDPRFRSAS